MIRMRFVTIWSLLILVALSLLLVPASYAQDDGQARARYVILLQDAPIALYEGGIPGLAATTPAVTGARKLDPDSPASQAYESYLTQQQADFQQVLEKRLGRSIPFELVYHWALNGVAVQLTPDEAAIVRQLPGVRAVAPDRILELQTDHGPEWIGAPAMWGAPHGCIAGGFCGEGVIVGIIDTGINHDHASFADIGDDGYDHVNPYGSGVYKGACIDTPSLCNDKLIGMNDYTGAGVEDTDGHGSHTASTAGGNFLNDVTLTAPTISFQVDISGVAPHVNIISYRVCNGGCYSSYAASAVDDAIEDEVDVLNYSIGISPSVSPWSDSNLDAQAFLAARAAGIFVAVAGGNSGPGAETLLSPAISPWVLTVGAATHNRAFLNSLVNMTTDQNTTLPDIEGRSITKGYGPAPIVYAGDYNDNNLCKSGIWSSNTFNGEIVVCDRGAIARVDKSANVETAGGGGMVLANASSNGNSLNADEHSIPAVHITYDDGVALKNWLGNGDTGHKATIAGSTMAVDDGYGDIMAAFSSRGPNEALATQRVIKPDIVAPGVDIVAAVATDGSTPAPELGVESGTSMASPHSAGAAALLVQAHPDWTPAEIQSALMMTAWQQDLRDDDGVSSVTPFDVGAGRVDLNVASDAGFIMAITKTEYENADPASGGDPSTLNMPSLATDAFNNGWTWTRTLKATRAGTWEIAFDLPTGMSMTASPASFSFGAAGEEQTVTFTAHGYGFAQNQWYFAQVNFRDTSGASPDAHFPVAVKSTCAVPSAPTVSVTLNGTDIDLSWDSTGDSYEVWRSETPYFTPADATAQKLSADGYSQTSYTDAGAGDGQKDYFYKVIARNTCGGASSDREDQDGIFSYTLVPGSP